MDPLSALLVHATPEAKIFFAGTLCQNSTSDDYQGGGHLHLLRSGAVMLREEGGRQLAARRADPDPVSTGASSQA